MDYSVRTHNLCKYYGKSRGIDGVDLSVKTGDFFAFIGPNGAGKSTTIRILLGLLTPSDGQAEIFGLNCQKHTTEILARAGYLPAEASFYSGLTVRETLLFSARMRKKDCTRASEELCERFGLDMSRKVGQLSLGNRKKVGIICALQHEPELYIFDEPTSGLDPLMQHEFFSILEERHKNGATVFLSSHNLSEVERYCKTAAVIRDGKILACDSIDKLGSTGAKRVTLHGIKNPPVITGMIPIKQDSDSVTFLYSGKADALIKELTAVRFDDITITDPDLDEVFMHFYSKEETK